jgi:hypothetical protein
MPLTDPFTEATACTVRLFSEWKRHPKLIVAVDFDSTVFDYYQGGHSFQRVLDILRKCKLLGFYVVVFTAADPSRFEFMKNFLLDKGIEIDSINQNPIPLPYGNHGKIYYNILLDDRAGLSSALDTLETVVGLIIDGIRNSIS